MRCLLIICVLALASCSLWKSKDGSAGVKFEAGSLEVRELRRALLCETPNEEAVVRWFPGPADLAAWDGAERLHLETLDLPADRSFILVEQGLRRTGGYSLELNRKAQVNKQGVLRMQGEWLEPAEDRMVTQILTSLCVLVAVPAKPYSRLEVFDQTGRLRAANDLR